MSTSPWLRFGNTIDPSILALVNPVQTSSWAILLCRFSDTTEPGQPISFYQQLFTGAGAGTLNMTDFFRDMSHGKLDLTASQVFGWYTLPYAKSAYIGNLPTAPAGFLNRIGLINACRQAATSAPPPGNVDLSRFDGVVVAMPGVVDLFGVIGGMAAVCDDKSLQPSLLGQEMGHGYGLDHSRKQGDEDDYQDPWDIMSTASYLEAANSLYTFVGPGMNAWNMRSRGWLLEDRVWKTSSTTSSFSGESVQLRPLHRRHLPGYLAAEIGEYLVEFRVRELWDGGLEPCILVHRFELNHSYIMPGTSGQYNLVAGDTFQLGTAEPAIGSFLQVQVNSIDPQAHTANIGLTLRHVYQPPALVGSLFGAVARGGGGGIRIGSHIIPVPPHGVESQLLRELASAVGSQALSDPFLAQQARTVSLARIAQISLTAVKASSDITRSPNKARQDLAPQTSPPHQRSSFREIE